MWYNTVTDIEGIHCHDYLFSAKNTIAVCGDIALSLGMSEDKKESRALDKWLYKTCNVVYIIISFNKS